MELEDLQEDTGLNEACGLFGCVASRWPTQLNIADIIGMGLVGVQHRGQESAGMVTGMGGDSYKLNIHKGMGLVSQVFKEDITSKMKGNLGIGHTRYSTAGVSELGNCQPFVVETLHGRIAVAHNGELINSEKLKKRVLRHGVGLSSGSDTELIAQLLSLEPPEGDMEGGANWGGRIKHVMGLTPLAYSLLIMHRDEIYACRDPFGNRPLCIGRLMSSVHESISEMDEYELSNKDQHEGIVVSSESCSFQAIGASYYREIVPGEIVKITKDGIKSIGIVGRPKDAPPAFCIFEYVYFARPDSMFEGQQVYTVRMRCGSELAVEAPADVDLVSTVPESATPAAMGYAAKLGIPYVEVLCKNRYIGRTFIQPTMRLRQMGVAKKFGALTDNVRDKRIVLVDDSIVRGNTMGPIIKLLRRAGAKEVHVRLASPPLKYPCYMGINIPTRDELIANKMNHKQLAIYLGADSVVYLSVEGLKKAVQEGIQNKEKEGKVGHCVACLTGDYPAEW